VAAKPERRHTYPVVKLMAPVIFSAGPGGGEAGAETHLSGGEAHSTSYIQCRSGWREGGAETHLSGGEAHGTSYIQCRSGWAAKPERRHTYPVVKLMAPVIFSAQVRVAAKAERRHTLPGGEAHGIRHSAQIRQSEDAFRW